MIIEPWKILETKYLHQNIRLDTCELSNGRTLNAHLLEYADEIMIFALTKNQEVVLIKQYRHGVQRAILELPSGSVDDGESPLEAAKRELMEETGYAGDAFIEIGCGSPNPTIYTNRIYSFLAMNAEQLGKQSAQDAETVEVSLIPLDKVVVMALSGDLIHSLNISTLFFALGFLKRIL
jgi:ADP-ribose pyrophosphatase